MAVAISNTANPAGSASTGTTTRTYTGLSTGTAAHDRVIVVLVGSELTSGTITAATIDGNSMTATTLATQGIVYARAFYRPWPLGTTADIAVTFGASQGDTTQHIYVYSVTGAQGAASFSGSNNSTDMDVSTPLTTGSITIATNGGFIACTAKASDTTTATWANATGSLDVDAGTFRFQSATRITALSATAVTCTGSTNNEDGCMAWIGFVANASVERLPAQTNLALSPTTPSVTEFNAGWSISPAQTNLAISSVAMSQTIVKDLNTVDLALSTTIPTRTAAAGVAFSPEHVELAFFSPAPTAVTSGVSLDLTPARVDLALSATAPSRDFGRFPFPAAQDLALSTTAPTILAGVFKDIPQGNLALSPTVPTSIRAVVGDPPRCDLALSPTAPTANVFPQFTHSLSPPRVDLVISSVAMSQTIVKDLNTVDLALSTTAPTRDAPIAVSGLPAQGNLALSTSTATVTVSSSNNTTIVVDTCNLVISPTAPAQTLTKDLNSDDLVISATAPTASTGNLVGFTVPQTDLVIFSSAPDSGLASDITCGQLVLSTTVPMRSTALSANPARVDLAISSTIPTVVVSASNNITKVPAARDLALSPTAPTLVLQQAIVPGARDLAISGTAPSLSFTGSFSLSPPSVNLLFSTIAASVIRAVAGDSHPASNDLVLSTTAPTASLGFYANPPQTNLVLSKFAPDRDRAILGEKVPPRRDLVISTTAPTFTATSAGAGAARGNPFIASVGTMMTR